MAAAGVESSGCLRREHFVKGGPRGWSQPLRAFRERGGDFSFDGHRLCNLYRMDQTGASGSPKGYRKPAPVAALQRYPIPPAIPGASHGGRRG